MLLVGFLGDLYSRGGAHYFRGGKLILQSFRQNYINDSDEKPATTDIKKASFLSLSLSVRLQCVILLNSHGIY
jgi:hypothetical protein